MADPVLARLRAIVRSLPETGEKTPWGPDPHWTVRDKIFAGYGGGSLGVKVDKELQAALVASDPRFSIAAYVGKHGWVDMRLGPKPDWAEVEALVLGSYRMIAPKKLAAQVGGPTDAAASARSKPAASAKLAAKAKPAAPTSRSVSRTGPSSPRTKPSVAKPRPSVAKTRPSVAKPRRRAARG